VDLPNLRHLEVLREVARRGSVSAAARAVHRTQPAVTQAVVGLEATFGGRLFFRTAAGMQPTPAGSACALRVARTLELLTDALAETARARGRDAAAVGAGPLRGITAAQLRALLQVVESGTFGRAARAHGVARATLHRAVRQLEQALGTPLFEATSHGLRPTRDAERLARRVRLAQAELEQARDEVASAVGHGGGTTVIGAMPLARSALVPAAVLQCSAARPEHTVSILDGPYDSMLDALRHGRADVLVGALRDAAPDDVVQQHLFDDPLALVVRAGHPLALAAGAGRATDVRALTGYAWIAPRPGSPLRRQYAALVAAIAAPPVAAPIECNSLVAARALLLASDRVMLLSAHQVHHELAAGQVAVLPHPLGSVVRRIGLTTRRDWRPTAAQADVLEALRRQAQALAVTARRSPRFRAHRGRGRRAARPPSAA
jgi:DNA-binding transcriptional LysR family regulator